jgi:phage shock protein PspC (stress-responsive transcriptional regulator)
MIVRSTTYFIRIVVVLTIVFPKTNLAYIIAAPFIKRGRIQGATATGVILTDEC